jgi:hypothetical protein
VFFKFELFKEETMNSKQPISFLFFVINTSLQLIAITCLAIFMVKNPNPDPTYVGICVFGVWLIVWILAGIGIFKGAMYKTEERRNRIYNRIGVTGNVLHYILHILFIIYAMVKYA